MFLIFGEHVVLDLHQDIEAYLLEFVLNLVVLLLEVIDVLVFGAYFAL
jgi:hypothetical protein